MQKDLFGNDIPVEESKCIRSLKELDSNTLEERARRCEFMVKYFPSQNLWFGSTESYFIFIEIKLAFISGCFISTIILAQAFIERKFQEEYHLSLYPDPKAEFSLSRILKELRTDKTLDPYWIDRIDTIRKKRNPFVHYRKTMNEYSIMERSGFNHSNAVAVLEDDAKDALEIMFVVARMRLNRS